LAKSFIQELKRRNVFKVAASYLVLAWIVIQFTSEAVPALHLPEWVNSLVFYLGLIAFPFVLFFAWAFEITPEGLKRDHEVTPEESIAHDTGRKIDFIIIGLLVIALTYFIYESRFKETADPISVVTEQDSDTAKQAVNSGELAMTYKSSIAVLPFVNMSSDSEQEYFSDGISEEILNVLAQIPHLHVTSRSSAFAFKGSKINISEVAQKLGVKHVLEGSVRKAGNKVRITAQLIEADSDLHLWSETYDRELDDIFAIQDEISSAIVTALKQELNLENEQVAINSATKVDSAAYHEYLKGRFFIEKRTKESLEQALSHFTKARDIAPNYAPAWMGVGWSTLFLSESYYGDIPTEVAIERARPAIEQAIALDSDSYESFGVLGMIEGRLGNVEKANAAYDKAISINPNYANGLSWYGGFVFDDPGKRFALRERAYKVDPLSALALGNYIFSLMDYGRFDEATKKSTEFKLVVGDNFMYNRIMSELSFNLGEEGKATYYVHKWFSQNDSNRASRGLGYSLADLGLTQLAGNVFKGRENAWFKHLFNNNIELLLTEIQARYPRAENDRRGYFIRAVTELDAGNYQEAASFFEKSFCDRCIELAYSLKFAGFDEQFQEVFNYQKQRLQSELDAGKNNFNLVYMEFDLAFLAGDIDGAIAILESDAKKGRLYYFGYDTLAYFQALRAHPKWSALKALNEQEKLKEQAIYLSMAQADNSLIRL
jgi:TolB-like protein